MSIIVESYKPRIDYADPTGPYIWPFPKKPQDIYIAASLHGHVQALQLALNLTKLGFNVTSRWLLLDFKNLPQEKLSIEWIQTEVAMGKCDIDDILMADTVVSLLDPPSSSGGTHFEVGYFMGLGKTNVLAVGDRPNLFFWNEHVRYLPNIKDVGCFLLSDKHGSYNNELEVEL